MYFLVHLILFRVIWLLVWREEGVRKKETRLGDSSSLKIIRIDLSSFPHLLRKASPSSNPSPNLAALLLLHLLDISNSIGLVAFNRSSFSRCRLFSVAITFFCCFISLLSHTFPKSPFSQPLHRLAFCCYPLSLPILQSFPFPFLLSTSPDSLNHHLSFLTPHLPLLLLLLRSFSHSIIIIIHLTSSLSNYRTPT